MNTPKPPSSLAPAARRRFRVATLVAALPTLLLACWLSAPCAAAARLTGPDGHEYEVVLDPGATFTWADARTRAQNAGGHLATIDSEAVDLFIETLRQQALGDAGYDPFAASAPPLWIGGSQSPSANTPANGWTWIFGGAIPNSFTSGYSNWLGGEPNDWPSTVEDHEEDYLAIGHQGRYGWIDRTVACRGYVVEYDVTPLRGNLGPIYNPANGHWYQFVLGHRPWTWDEARQAAECRTHNGLAGHLLIVDSAEEAAFVQSYRPAALATIGFNPSAPTTHWPLWIAGRQRQNAGSPGASWFWVEGETETPLGSGFTDWISGQPDDAPGAGSENNEQNHLGLGRAGGGWSDETAPLIGYIVEYSRPIPTELQLRSSRYDGSGGMRFGYRAGFTRNVAMTVEAWVYRESDSRVETILSQGFTNSIWFGFVGKTLRFYRSGGALADATIEVPRGQWTHVAASYDGSFVRFYVDGESAGERALSNNGTGTADDLYLGRDPGGVPYHFLGHLDEVRLWSATRSRTQIRDGMCEELRGLSGLEAVWPRGGHEEIVAPAHGVSVGNAPVSRRLGILPQHLVVPAAPLDPKFDGNVDPSGEYLGAEQVVLRYQDGPNFHDATAYLVHTKDYLYVGVEGARNPSSGAPSLNNAVSVYLDAQGATTAFNDDMRQGSVLLADGASSFSRVQNFTIIGPGGIPNTITSWGSYNPPSYSFQTRMGTERRDEVSSAPDLEFRIHRSQIGGFGNDVYDRFALTHTDNGGPNGNRATPKDADRNSVATWLDLRYYPLPGGNVPRASVQVSVMNSITGGPQGSVPVVLKGTGVNYATAVTDAGGLAQFNNVAVGLNDPLTVEIDPPDGTLPNSVFVALTGTQPDTRGSLSVTYPGCPGGSCSLAAVTFTITPPVGAVQLTAFSPTATYPPILLRGGSDPKRVDAPAVTVTGTNLHPLLEFHFARPHCPVNLSGCTEGIDYWRATSTFRPAEAGQPARHEVAVPLIPESRYGSMRLTAHDVWSRPANNPTLAGSWRNFPSQISVGPPPYHLLHAFAFENERDGHDLDDYRAAFPDQICDLRYMVGFWAFAPIYLDLTGNGECVGMTATAQQIARGRAIAPLHPDVLYGNGFPTAAGSTLPIMPATFNTFNPCSPSPTNVWAVIKANQGAQYSSEFIGAALSQFEFNDSGMTTDLRDQIAKIRTRPTHWLLCVRKGTKGHCVQPLRVIDTVTDAGGTVLPNRRQIEVWDNNFPNTTRIMDVDLDANTYTYDGGFGGGEPVWTESWMFVFEVDPLYNGDRHVPSIDTLGYALGRFGITHLWEFFQLFVAGEAEPLVTAGDGSQTGWRANGTFVETGRQTAVIPNFNWIAGDNPPLGHYPLSMHHRMDLGAPAIELHNRGDEYKVHTSHHGTMFQFFVENAKPGATDRLHSVESAGRVLGQRFEAGQSGRLVGPRIALCRNQSEYPVAVGMDSLPVPPGQSIGLRTRPDGTGFGFDNDTTGSFKSAFTLTVADPNGDQPIFADTPDLTLPAGSRLAVRSPDGGNFLDLVFEVDHDRDGSPEQSLQFLSATGNFVPWTAPADAWLDVRPADDGYLALVHPVGLQGWTFQFSGTLDGDWQPFDTTGLDVVVQDGLVFTYLPVQMPRCFFRLAHFP